MNLSDLSNKFQASHRKDSTTKHQMRMTWYEQLYIDNEYLHLEIFIDEMQMSLGMKCS